MVGSFAVYAYCYSVIYFVHCSIPLVLLHCCLKLNNKKGVQPVKNHQKLLLPWGRGLT